MSRAASHLNFGWRFAPAAHPQYLEPGFDDSGLAVVDLPHSLVELPHTHALAESYAFAGTYRRPVDAGPLAPGHRALLHVDGALTASEVYLDGHRVGGHLGGWTPFTLDLTPHLDASGRGVLAVVVDGTERPDVPPFGGVVDYLGYAGLSREVRLEVVPPVHVADVVVRPSAVLSSSPTLEVGVELESVARRATRVRVDVTLQRLGDVVARAETSASAPAAAHGAPRSCLAVLRMEPGAVDLWQLQDPALYDLVVTVTGAGEVLDTASVRTGFREAEFRPDGFYLNGERLVLRGLNRHQSFPYVGAAMPRSAQRRDAEILVRDLGVQIVRLSHYPQSPHFLDACDELGLLVFEEMPGWQHIGDAEWQSRAVADVEAMVRRDRNRPSVVLWGVRINESPDDDAFYAATNARARALDPTRPTGGVRNVAGSRLLEDVYTYNDFGHRGTNRGLRPARDVTRARVPYLVTEHTGHMFPTKSYDHEGRRLEHALRHLRVLDAAYAAPDVAGAIGWCFVDYPTHREFGSGDRICHHGVLDAFRVPKTAAAGYASQQDATPVLEIGSAMIPGELDASEIRSLHVFTNCDEVRLFRDGEEVGTYLPDRDAYPALPHPPVVVTDLVGRLIERHEKFSRRDAERVKRILATALEVGVDGLCVRSRCWLTWFRLRYGLTRDKAIDLYLRYVAGWGSSAIRWDLEGYTDGVRVATARRCTDGAGRLDVQADTDTLVESVTYDVCRVVVRHVDGAGTRQVHTDVVIHLEAEGAGQIIGPTTVALVGGARAFWVRTNGGSGPLVVRVRSDRFEAQEVRLHVEKVPVA